MGLVAFLINSGINWSEAPALEAIRNYCKLHGVTIRSSFADFDPHQRGVVTESQVTPFDVSFLTLTLQFQRCLPAPASMAPSVRGLVMAHYRRPGLNEVPPSVIPSSLL